MPAGLSRGAAQVVGDGRRVAVSEGVDGRGNLRRRVRPRRHGPLHEHAAADRHLHRVGNAGHARPSRSPGSARISARAAGTSRRCRRSARGSAAARCRRANIASIPSPALCPCRHAAGQGRRKDAVDADRADALRVKPHIGEGMVRPVGDPEDVPLLDAERQPQVFEVGGALDRVVGAQVDAERLEPLPAFRASLSHTPSRFPARRRACRASPRERGRPRGRSGSAVPNRSRAAT